MSSTLELVAAAHRTGAWDTLVQQIPYFAFLGLRLEQREGVRTVVMPFAPHLVGNPVLPALHGGTLAGALEAVAQLECLARSPTPALPKTITLTVDYLRSGRPQDTFARAAVVKQGRRVTTLHARAWQEDEAQPIATATVHLLVL